MPSRVAAVFIKTKGRPVVMNFSKNSIRDRHSFSRMPTSTVSPCSARNPAPPPGTLGFGSLTPIKNPFDTGLENRLGARGGSSLVVAGFQGDVQVGATGHVPGPAKSHHLGMRGSGLFVPALGDHSIPDRDHGSDHWIGRSAPPSFPGLGHGPGHHLFSQLFHVSLDSSSNTLRALGSGRSLNISLSSRTKSSRSLN